jgi:hypothetical protein
MIVTAKPFAAARILCIIDLGPRIVQRRFMI